MNEFAVITTFPSSAWNIYAKQMLESFTKFFPQEIPILIQVDDAACIPEIGKIIRSNDAIAEGWTQDHADFVARNKDKDDPSDYRRQVTRFSHKVFAIHRAWQAVQKQKQAGGEAPRYLIWLDADTTITRPVTMDDIKECLPKDGDAVSFLGRKDWPHSECGWLAFDLEHDGGLFIDVWHGLYASDAILSLKETHDSWAFDHVRLSKDAPKCTNLTEDKPGMDIWPQSPMGKWSTHHKGPIAKKNMAQPTASQLTGRQQGGLVINTKNSIPDEEIRAHIAENQKLIKNWVRECTKTDEQIVVVSAGPQMAPEEVLDDYHAGKKIVAVKHALGPLKDVGITPWASILLDPRPHVYDFVQNPDTDILWFVASQVDPKVTAKLLASGCTVWGYHASVGANEDDLTALQSYAVIGGGSATATRGLFLLKHLGFYRIKLFGYDLCIPDKPDLNAIDEHGQPRYLEISVGWNNPLAKLKKCFWSEPQLIAQFEEMNQLIQNNTFEFEAVGDGIVPFIVKGKKWGEMRAQRLKVNIGKPVHHRKLLKCSNSRRKAHSQANNLIRSSSKMTMLWAPLHNTLRKTLRKTTKATK